MDVRTSPWDGTKATLAIKTAIETKTRAERSQKLREGEVETDSGRSMGKRAGRDGDARGGGTSWE